MMDDDYVDTLTAEQSNENGLLLELLSSGYEEWDFVAAVEGPDDPAFYFDFVRDALPGSEVHYIRCGGKDALIRFRKRVGEYEWVDPPTFLFLCDKDFDDYLGKTEIGVWYTDLYSIESYLALRSHVSYLIQKHASRPLKAADREAVLDRYDARFAWFSKRVRAYSAYICEVRAKSEHPQFDLFGIDKLFDLSRSDLSSAKGRSAAAIRTMNISVKVSVAEILARARLFDAESALQWLRGKLALQIARKCFELATKDSPPTVRSVLPPSNLISRDHLCYAMASLGQMPSLKLYCATAI